jgi:glycosyltransferase involved in cell wall biosynthesis
MAGVTITFVVPVVDHPVGAVMAIYEFAAAMCRIGHQVHLVHVDLLGTGVRDVDDIGWFALEESVQHRFMEHFEEEKLPPADFISHLGGGAPQRGGLPFMFVQGYRVFPEELENRLFREPCPKVCTASWLVGVGSRLGVPAHQLVHVPYGLEHDKYRLVSPIEDRPLQVAMCYSSHPSKGPKQGLDAIARVKGRVPELEAVVFGTMDPADPMPPGCTYMKSPDQHVIVNDIYNCSRVFVCSSVVEGFGLPCIEAMACGCALVTTANGGSAEYAIDGETALVSGPRDVAMMVDQIEALLQDDDRRIELAIRGNEFVRRFDWEVSARKLEAFLHAYGADPDYYRQPATVRN